MRTTWLACLWIVGVAGIGLMQSTARAQAAACGCGDVADLQNRLNMVHAAIDHLEAELAATGRTITVDARAPGAKKNNKDLLRDSIDKAMGQVKRVGLRGGTGDTDGMVCKPEVAADSPCLTSVLNQHEALHHTRCTADRNKRKLGVADDRFTGMLMTDYMKEEIDSYRTEIGDILQRLRALPASCRPAGWFGLITAFEDKRVTTDQESQPSGKYALKVRERSDDHFQRWMTLWYADGKASAYTHAKRVFSTDKTSGTMISCVGGLKPMPPDRAQVNTYHAESVSKGYSDVPPPLSIDVTVDRLYYQVGFHVPALKGGFDGLIRNSSRGACLGDSNPPDIPLRDDKGFNPTASDALLVKGRTASGGSYIGGLHRIPMLAPNAAPAIPGINENRYDITVRLHLRRLQ